MGISVEEVGEEVGEETLLVEGRQSRCLAQMLLFVTGLSIANKWSGGSGRNKVRILCGKKF